MTTRPDSPPVRPGRRRPPRGAVALVFAAILAPLALIGIQRVEFGGVRDAFLSANPELLIGAVALFVVAQTLSGAMWATCQEAGGVRAMPLATALGIHWATRATCEVTPAGIGESVRVGLVRRHPAGAEAGAMRILGGVVGYRAVDAAVAVAAVLVLALALPVAGPAIGVSWTALGLVALLAVAAVAWRLGARRHMVAVLPARLRQQLRRLVEGIAVLRDRPALTTASGLAALAVTARLLSLLCLMVAFGLPPGAIGLAFAAIVLAGAVPAAPGAAGTRELLLVPTLVIAHQVPAESALAFSLAIQGVALSASLVLGALAFSWLWPRLRHSAPQAADEASAGDAPPARFIVP